MTQRAAIDLGVELVVLARSEDEPAVRAGARHLFGDPDDIDDLRRLAAACEVVTFDHEGTPADLVEKLAAEGQRVLPAGPALRAAQDKLVARRALAEAGVPVPPFTALGADALEATSEFAGRHGWPVVLKLRSGGYDGRGVAVVSDPMEAAAVLEAWAGREVMVEGYVDMAAELAVVAARTPSGYWSAYPLVATTQVEGICRELVMPAPVPAEVAARAQSMARSIADGIDAVGIIAVEMFLSRSGELLVNELALRPHNSGHATIEGAVTSQFHNHLRAVLDWPLGSTDLVAPAAAMVNVLAVSAELDPARLLPQALAVPGASVHLYGKSPAPGRKVGHVTALGASAAEALDTARRAAALLSGEPTPA
jgi:5-(carboxyamino)imidazole ribonucleotide synthase